MRTLRFPLLVILVCLGLAGCGNDDPSSTTDVTSTPDAVDDAEADSSEPVADAESDAPIDAETDSGSDIADTLLVPDAPDPDVEPDAGDDVTSDVLEDAAPDTEDAAPDSPDVPIEPDVPSLGALESGPFEIVQSWSQETSFARRVDVQVPRGPGPHPAVIILHGAGGTGTGFIRGAQYLRDAILVAPSGYDNGWNVTSEATQAPDVEFIREVLARLHRHTNVEADNIAILGVSNGSALVNRLLIELEAGTFTHAVSIVSQLTENQYDGGFRYDPTGGNAYDTPITPASGRRIMAVGGTLDPLIPYAGGRGVLNNQFLPAQQSAFIWAQAMGFEGAQLSDGDGVPDTSDPNVVAYRYLGGDVVHLKVIDGAHNSGGNAAVQAAIVEFLGY